MSLAYRPPGVTINELASPSVNTVLAIPATICIVGQSQGYTTRTDQIAVGPSPATALNGAVAADDTTFTVDSATSFATSGTVIVGTEVVSYSGTTGTTLTGVVRGLYGTTAATHADNAPITAVTVLAAPTGSAFQPVSGSQSFEAFLDLYSPTKTYAENTDFDVTLISNNQYAVITGLANDLDDVGATIRVTYRHLPSTYFLATRLNSHSQVEALYGPAYSSDAVGNASGIGSRVSYAANLAFENGATDVIIQPLFKLATPGDNDSQRVQPSAVEAADANNWEATLYGLRDIEDINLIVPVVGQSDTGIDDDLQSSIIQKVQDHAFFMKSQGQYVIAVVGEDGSATLVDPDVIRGHATLLRDRYGGDVAENIVFVSPSRFSKALPTGFSSELLIGGQYVAAAIAGMVASRPTSSPLTRKQVAGLKAVLDPRNRAQKDADAQAGLLVVEQRGLAIQVRHGITIDNSSTAKRELSVVRSKHRMMESVRTTLDGALPIVANGNAASLLQTIVIGVLEELRANRELVSYSNVQSRILEGDPTTGEVRFSYAPAYPLNNVDILFSVDLTTGTITGVTP